MSTEPEFANDNTVTTTCPTCGAKHEWDHNLNVFINCTKLLGTWAFLNAQDEWEGQDNFPDTMVVWLCNNKPCTAIFAMDVTDSDGDTVLLSGNPLEAQL